MLQAPTNDRKTKSEASSKTAEHLSEQEQPVPLLRSRQSDSMQQRENLAAMQNVYGNQALLRMGRSHPISPLSPRTPLLQRQSACGVGCLRCQKKPGIQTKLKISEPGDQYEQEADQIADQVMRMPEPFVKRQIEPEAKEIVQTKKTSKEAVPVNQDQAFSQDQSSHNQGSKDQGSPNQGLVGMSPLLNQVLNSPGHPLDTETRTFMESRFGYDFGFVKLHTDMSASASTKEIGALAYTVRNHIVLNERSYAPATPEGKKLLAHELTHVVQQSLADFSESISMQGNQQHHLSSRCTAVAPHVARSVDDWLTTSVNVSAMSYTELLSEIDELSQFLQRQTESSADTVRIEEALTHLRSEAARREAATRRRTRLPSRRRGSRTVTSDSSVPLRRPRILMEMTSVAYENPQEMRAEFDLIMEWLAREDLSTGDLQMLTLERDNLAPQLQQDRQRIVRERHAARLATALTPDDENAANTLEQLARTIQMIESDSGNPAISYLYHQGERLAISSEQAETLRHGLLQQLIHTSNRIESRASYYWERYNSQLAINRDSPIIASISGWLADVEDPGDELMQRYFWAIHRLRALRARARAGQMVEAAAIMAPIEQASQEIRTLARAFYEGHIEGAEIAVSRLEDTRNLSFTIAGSIAAVVAAPVVAGYVAGAGFTGATATVLTVGGTGLTVGTGTGVVRGASAVGGELAAGNSLNQALDSFSSEFSRGFREGAIAGTAGGAARLLGLAAGASVSVGEQVFIRVAGDFVVNSTATMLDVLWQSCASGNCDVDQAVRLGITSGLTSIPSSIVGFSNSTITRNFLAPLTAGATTYVGAISSGASPEEAMRSAGIAVTSQLAMSRAAHGTDTDTALFERGHAMGANTRETVTYARRRLADFTTAVMIGTADPLPSVRSGYGGSPVVLAPDGPTPSQTTTATEVLPVTTPHPTTETMTTTAPTAATPEATATTTTATEVLPVTTPHPTTETMTTTAPTAATPEATVSVPRRESAGARRTARPSSTARAAIDEAAEMGFIDSRLHSEAPIPAEVATATSGTARSITTSIRAQTAEVSAYDARLSRGEVGLLAPVGANVTGADYATAVEISPGVYEVVVVDAKSRVSDTSAFGTVRQTLPQTWHDSVDDAIGRLSLGDPLVEQAVRDAWTQGRIRIARDTIDYSASGQGDLRLDN